MRDNAAGEEALPSGVKIHAPRIAGPFSEDVKLPVFYSIAPHSCVDFHAVDHRMGKNAVQSIQLAIRAPLEGVQRFMGIVAAETLEQNLLFIAFAGPLAIAEEKEIWRGTEKDPAVAHLNTACQVKADR